MGIGAASPQFSPGGSGRRMIRGSCPVAAKNLQETGPRQPRRRGIDERVEIDRIAAHQRLVEDERHPPLAVVDEPEGRHRAGLDAEDQAQLLGRAEGQPPGGADRLVQPLEVDAGLGIGDDEEQAALCP